MEISEEEAETILESLGDEDGDITEKETRLEKRIRQEFPAIDEELKKSEHYTHLWQHEVEDDKRVKEARERLDERYKPNWNFYLIIQDINKVKKAVIHELLEKEKANL